MKKISLKLFVFFTICLMTVFCMQPTAKAQGVCQDVESLCLANCPVPGTCTSACVDEFEACCRDVPKSRGCSPEAE